MIPIEPTKFVDGARLVVFGKGQPQYLPLPAALTPTGVMTTEWEPTADELQILFTGGHIRICVRTFNQPLQPLSVDVIAQDAGFSEDR